MREGLDELAEWLHKQDDSLVKVQVPTQTFAPTDSVTAALPYLPECFWFDAPTPSVRQRTWEASALGNRPGG